jgi:8-oxo-dGTP diphosphatase
MAYTYEYPHPAVTTDTVIFTVRDGRLEVLLIRRGQPPEQGKWAIPGGFVNIDEDLEEGARRELEEETGVRDVAYLEQLHTFGHPERDPRERIITVVFYGAVAPGRSDIRAGDDADAASWFDTTDLPDLAFDHAAILDMACARLRARLASPATAFRFLPRYFTLSELQQVYEVILGEPQDKRNFRKRILSLGLVKATGKDKRDGAHRPARLYRARNRKGPL